MTRRRWIADEVFGSHAALVGDHAVHLIRVLRARIGQEFDIATGSEVRRGRVIKLDPRRVEFELGEIVPATAAPSLTVALSIFKFDRMEWAIEKCTELGVTQIVPVIAARTESHMASTAVKRVERWQRLAKQSSEQSRRASAPDISQPIKLKELLSLGGDVRIVLSEVEQDRMLKEVVSSASTQDSVVLAFGPEGGWTEAEIEAFTAIGWTPASLGDTILRAETAAIAAVAITLSLL